MKKVINGRVYDTNTAEQVGYYDNGRQRSDFEFFEERLYRKKTGEYFLYGAGGRNSKYGEWYGNKGGSAEKIVPMSIVEARGWTGEKLPKDEYENIFGNPKPDDGRVSLNLYVSRHTKATLQRMGAEQGKSLSKIIDDLVGNIRD